jgi:cell pole-organizing protein PopZ
MCCKGFTMKPKTFRPALIAAAIAALGLPLGAQTALAAEADVAARIEALTQELQALKAQVQAQQKAAQDAATAQAQQAEQVKAVQAQSLGGWLATTSSAWTACAAKPGPSPM